MTKSLALALVTILVAASHPSNAAGPNAQVRGARPSPVDLAHARALELFRGARFSEAYGRFIELAEVGHPASARYAIWMCENGTALFNVPWDCAPHQLEDWRALAGDPNRGPAGGPGAAFACDGAAASKPRGHRSLAGPAPMVDDDDVKRRYSPPSARCSR